MTVLAERAMSTLPLRIDRPGIYDIDNDTYHGDPVLEGSLSVSGARKLLPPSCPALFKYERDHGRKPTAAFDFGHAAHRLVLGAGADLVVVDADDWRTKDARDAKTAAHAEGKTPILAAEYLVVEAMAQALREHPIASVLFRPGTGQPERSAFWLDPEFNVWRRARFDWLPNPTAGRLIIPDYKSCISAAPEDIERSIHSYGYHQQADWYVTIARALNLGRDVVFLFVFQEKTPPYLVTVAQPSQVAMEVGRALNRRALRTYVECTRTGRWPGYSDDVILAGLPAWAERRFYQEEDR